MIGLLGQKHYSVSNGMKLTPTETELIGRWKVVNGQVRADATCERIQWLTSGYLEKISASGGGWETLFRDPDDGRYWERTYPMSEIQGGDPPSLLALSPEKANAKYGFKEFASSGF